MSLFTTRISDWFVPRGDLVEDAPLAGNRLARLSRAQAIGYSPQLIDRLHGDHRQLLGLYRAVFERLAQQRYEQIPAALGVFKSKFDAHLVKENLRFYCYVEHKLSGQPLATIKEFRRNMSALARGVVNLVRKYQAAGVSAANRRVFEEELRLIGALLQQRIQAVEDELYPLYAP